MPYQDRKSTRLNSSHGSISYAVFCLKKKKQTHQPHTQYHHQARPTSPPQLAHRRLFCGFILRPWALSVRVVFICFFFFFFNDTATTEIYTLSLHDALPISPILFSLMLALEVTADTI